MITDKELQELFPDLVAEIVPNGMLVRNRVEGREPMIERPRSRWIGLKIEKQTGMNPLTMTPIVQVFSYDIGPFDEIETTFRTDNIRAAKEHPPLVVLRALYEHDGHLDPDGNVKEFSLRAPEKKLLKMEKEAKKDPEVVASLNEIKGKGARPKHERFVRSVTRAPDTPEIEDEELEEVEA